VKAVASCQLLVASGSKLLVARLVAGEELLELAFIKKVAADIVAIVLVAKRNYWVFLATSN
jgi:hypothetical protein